MAFRFFEFQSFAMATPTPNKPSVGDVIIINIETKKGPASFNYVVKSRHENFLDLVRAMFPLRKFHISNEKDSSGKRIKGANPPFINSNGVYVFPCVESN